MNGNARYITVTDKDDGLRITIGVDWIKTVVEAHDGSAIIELVENRKGMDDMVFCKERYADVVELVCKKKPSNQ